MTALSVALTYDINTRELSHVDFVTSAAEIVVQPDRLNNVINRSLVKEIIVFRAKPTGLPQHCYVLVV